MDRSSGSPGTRANERKETRMNTTHIEQRTRRLIGRRFALISLVSVALISLLAVPALAAVQPVEQILRVTDIGHHSADLGLVESRLIFPPGARWKTDPEAGPLTLTVESGAVGVVLGGGLARIERRVSPLQEAGFQRLEPGQMTVLSSGDTLVVVRGYQLHVDNDNEIMAATGVSRIVLGPLPIVTDRLTGTQARSRAR
jgi:hypothetical protein